MADLSSILGSAGIGGAIGKAIVSLELDTKKYLGEMKAAEAQTKASTTTMGNSTTALAGIAKAGFAAIGVAAVAGIAVSIKAASDLGESLNKAKVVFGDASAGVVKFSETTAEKMGIAQSAALEAAGGFGAMAQSAGLSEGVSADLSTTMVKLAADMASFNNTDPSEMLERLRSGLSGEAEPLRKFGVFISEARVQQEALALGIAKANAELTDAQKVQARYSIILQDTNKQQGDFARTVGESIPNQIRKLRAELTDTAADIGTSLLPVVLDLAKALEGLLPIIEGVGKGLSIALSADTYTDIPVVGEALEALGAGFQAVGLAAQTSNDEIRRNGLPTLEEMKGTAGLVAAGITNLGDSVTFTTGRFNAMGAHVTRAAGELSKAGKEIAKDTETWVRDSIGSLDDFEKKWHGTSESAVKAMEGMAKQAKVMAKDLKALDKEGVPDKFILFLKEQGPDAVHEFVTGTEKQKARFLAAWRSYEKAVGDAADNMKRIAAQEAPKIGGQLVQGIVQGAESGRGTLNAKMESIIRDAIAHAKAAAGAASPSKRMHELGVDMMVGLANGISDAEQKAIDAASKAIQKTIDEVSSQLDKVKSKAQSFADTIRGAFSGFADIGGAFTGQPEEGALSLTDIISAQVGGAQTLADVLEALKRQGAGKALLANVAETGTGFGQALLGGGPQQIAEANQALKDIAKFSSDTGESLSKRFFGDQIGDLKRELKGVREDLHELADLEREGHSHDIVMDGQKVAEGVRNELVKTGKRNDGAGIP